MGSVDCLGPDRGRRIRHAGDVVAARRDARAGGWRARIRPPLILSHFLLAAAGLVVWIVYLLNDQDALAWIAFAMLAVVALLGSTMFAIWIRHRQTRPQGADVASRDVPPEQHFPVPIVALHGVLAVTTVVLVLLTALEVGGS